jgi:hypothetical protein
MTQELLASAAQLRGNAQDLRRQARAETDAEARTAKFTQAADEFRKASVMLQRGLRSLRREQTGHTAEVCRVLEALSQTLGSLGGTYRDAGKHAEAKDYYDMGNQYEDERRKNCAAEDTYNMLQRLVVRLLIDPSQLADSDFAREMAAAAQEIELQVKRGRNDSWALADLALVKLLTGVNAEKVIADLEGGRAESTFYESTYNAVAALLAEGLGKGDALGDRLEGFKRLLQRKGGLA